MFLVCCGKNKFRKLICVDDVSKRALLIDAWVPSWQLNDAQKIRGLTDSEYFHNLFCDPQIFNKLL